MNSNPIDPGEFQSRLLAWFEKHGRKDLPWRQQISPYRVWISEIMLQQTRVATVIPYFNEFIAHFPQVHDLAMASLDSVLRLWSGLGYYARARNLHRTAQIISDRGRFPNSLDQLCKLPGIGRSTAGAILSIAFKQPAPILDGNVKRVLARFQGVTGWPGDSRINRELWQLSELYTPTHRSEDYTQAIMDLGALLCRRNRPSCQLCPVQPGCIALRNQSTKQIPAPRPSKTLPNRSCFMLVLRNDQGHYYLEKRPPSGIWGGLWGLPQFDHKPDLIDWCSSRGVASARLDWWPSLRHTFSHFHLDYTPVVADNPNPRYRVMEEKQTVWYNPNSNQTYGMPTPVKRLLEQVVTGIQRPTGTAKRECIRIA